MCRASVCNIAYHRWYINVYFALVYAFSCYILQGKEAFSTSSYPDKYKPTYSSSSNYKLLLHLPPFKQAFHLYRDFDYDILDRILADLPTNVLLWTKCGKPLYFDNCYPVMLLLSFSIFQGHSKHKKQHTSNCQADRYMSRTYTQVIIKLA